MSSTHTAAFGLAVIFGIPIAMFIIAEIRWSGFADILKELRNRKQ